LPNLHLQSTAYQNAARLEKQLQEISSRHSKILTLMNWKLADREVPARARNKPEDL
jgi:hypothetical protein